MDGQWTQPGTEDVKYCEICGAKLPKTAQMCYVCKTTFNAEIRRKLAAQKAVAKEIRPAKRDTLDWAAVIVGLAGVLVCIIAMALPFHVYRGFSGENSFSLFQLFANFFVCGILTPCIVVSALIHKFTIRGNGIAQCVIGLLIMILALAKAADYEKKGVGVYVLILGGALILASGVMTVVSKLRRPGNYEEVIVDRTGQ